MISRLHLIAGIGALVGLARAVSAQCSPADVLYATDNQFGANFGYAVSVSNDIAIVGARTDGTNGTYAGAAYALERVGTQWIEVQKLVPDGVSFYDQFGSSVAISGNTMVVGSPMDDDMGSNAGAAYLFEHDGTSWELGGKLLASDGQPGDAFGGAVSVADGLIAVGARFDDNGGGVDAGAVYVYELDQGSWIETKLVASNGAGAAQFGISVSATEGFVLAGAYTVNVSSGAAYMFGRQQSSWVEEAILTAPDAAPLDHFGFAVSIRGDVAVIGAHDDDDNGSATGSAHVFRLVGETWQHEQKLVASDGLGGDHFGYSVGVDGDLIVVGAMWDSDQGLQSGSAYVFQYGGSAWDETGKLGNPAGASGDSFGAAAAVDGGSIVIGAYLDDNQGSVCIFDDCVEDPDDESPVPGDATGDGVVNVADLIAIVTNYGICDGDCPADLNNDGVVNVTDLIEVVNNWQI